MGTDERSNELKPHLVYLTGLSIDKLTLNSILGNINQDKHYNGFIKLFQELVEKPNEISSYSGKFFDIVKGVAKEIIDAIIQPPLFVKIAGVVVKNLKGDTNSKTTVDYKLDYIQQLNKDKVKSIIPSDLFYIFLANQSDSSAVASLGYLSKKIILLFAMHFQIYLTTKMNTLIMCNHSPPQNNKGTKVA